MKTWEMKAEPMSTSALDRWLSGKIPRRHLAIPFGGPTSGKAIGKADNGIGYDLDGEFFDAATDLYGPLAGFGRERLTDWHHVTFGDRTDPAGLMKGAILGRIVLDEDPSSENLDGVDLMGVWSDFWANAGEKRRQLVAMLERKGVPLFGSSQPLQKAVLIDKRTGHIDRWPVRFHTITTSPQNTHAVLPPMKADLLDSPYLAELSVGALRAFLADGDNLGHDLLSTPRGEEGAKAGRVLSGVNEADIDEAIAALLGSAEKLRTVLARQRKEPT